MIVGMDAITPEQERELRARFEAVYPVAEGHAEPRDLDLVMFHKLGHRPGDTAAHRKLMEEGPRRPIAAPPPVPEGVRDPSEERGGLAPDPQVALGLLRGRPTATPRPEPITCPTHGMSLPTPEGRCPLCAPAAAGEVIPGFDDPGPERDPLHPLYREPGEGLDFSKQVGDNLTTPPNVAAQTHQEDKTMTTAAPATTSPFLKADAQQKRAKILIYGGSGVGKTTLALHFPQPVVIDMERGTDHYAGSFQFDRLAASTSDEVMDAIQWLLDNDHEYRTVVIDPITIYWDALQKSWSDKFLKRAKAKTESAFDTYDMQPRDWSVLKGEFKELMRMLTALDMNVIVTARQKKEYADGQFMKVVGETFDGEKSLPYMFDTVLHLDVDDKGNRIAMTQKDRTNLMPKGRWPVSYDVFAKAFGDTLAKKATRTPFTPIAAPIPASDPQDHADQPAAVHGGNGSGANGTDPATPAQLAKLGRLAAGNQQTLDELLAMQGIPKATKKEASDLIGKMIAGGVKEVW